MEVGFRYTGQIVIRVQNVRHIRGPFIPFEHSFGATFVAGTWKKRLLGDQCMAPFGSNVFTKTQSPHSAARQDCASGNANLGLPLSY
jgi:hypothetical protein